MKSFEITLKGVELETSDFIPCSHPRYSVVLVPVHRGALATEDVDIIIYKGQEYKRPDLVALARAQVDLSI